MDAGPPALRVLRIGQSSRLILVLLPGRKPAAVGPVVVGREALVRLQVHIGDHPMQLRPRVVLVLNPHPTQPVLLHSRRHHGLEAVHEFLLSFVVQFARFLRGETQHARGVALGKGQALNDGVGDFRVSPEQLGGVISKLVLVVAVAQGVVDGTTAGFVSTTPAGKDFHEHRAALFGSRPTGTGAGRDRWSGAAGRRCSPGAQSG